MIFKDRADAGRQLAQQLLDYRNRSDVLVLGLARGGMMVAAEVASLLHLPLNVIVVRKIGAPGNPELALGALADCGAEILNQELIELLGVSREAIDHEVKVQSALLKERAALYRSQAQAPQLAGKIVILVDDGLATGSTMQAAIRSVRSQGVKAIVVAVPVAAPQALDKLKPEADHVVCLQHPPAFEAVGEYYASFSQVSDQEIMALLQTYSSHA